MVDDDIAHRTMLKTMLTSWDYAVLEAADGSQALNFVNKHHVDIVLMDIRMSPMDGMTAFATMHAKAQTLPVILMTAYSSVDNAVAAMQSGAYSYITKPLDFERLKVVLSDALSHIQEEAEIIAQTSHSTVFPSGSSEAIKELNEMILTIAPSAATVLITGESGTGKEIVAKAIQQNSLRKDKPFVTINCAALAENLLESELFGHEKGSFTGANKTREGRFALAHTGTIFLDEVGELPLFLQAKLLRVLQSGEIQRVGSDQSRVVDVRILAATNRNIAEEVREGKFREDLYYRLNVIPLEVPPLRERKEDIATLAQIFLERFSKENRKTIKGFSPECMDMLMNYNWFGNVRELENAIERAVILSAGEIITSRVLPLVIQKAVKSSADQNPSSNSPNHGNESLDNVEKIAILAMLTEVDDNKSEAAQRLGITRATLYSKLKKYKIQ